MNTFKVIDESGKTHEIKTEKNISVMELIREKLSPFGWGNCGGGMACATCHLYVESGNFPQPTAGEEDMLDFAEHVKPNSRLSCQLFISESDKDVVLKLVG